jgi:hypothetical protein
MSTIDAKQLEQLLTPEDVAELLRVETYLVHRLARRKINPLPCVALSSRSRRFRPAAVSAWLDRCGRSGSPANYS